MKALKKALLAVLGAVMGCCFFVGCLSTKMEVTYMVDGEVYRVQEYEMDTQISLPTAPTKEGYTFIGWYTDEALTVPYAEGAINQGITLYAKFSISTVYIVINTDGGTISNKAVEVVPGEDYTIDAPVKEGYTFVGYTYVDANGDEQEFPLSGKYPSSASIAITAKYQINKHTVKFVGETETEVSVDYGSTVAAQAAEKAGYNFDGWFTAAEGGEKFDFKTAIKQDVTLYAQYSPKTFTITVNGAQEGYANPSVVYGETYTLVAPELENFEFVKFTMNGKDFPATGTYTWTEDIAVDAVWDGEGKFVWFYDGVTELSDLRIVTEYDADMTAIRLPNVPAKDGYTTDNKWYTDAACTTEFVAEGKITTDVKLYAKYTANTYTVIFSVWDNALKAMKPIAVTATYGQPLTSLVPVQAVRESYDFNGYYYNGEIIDLNAPYAYLEGITIEEKWTAKAGASTWEENQEKLYFKERATIDDAWTFVYLVGATYEFAEGTTLVVDGTGATVSDQFLMVNAAGSFTLLVNGEARTVKAVEYVKSFTAGDDYALAWGVSNGDYVRNLTDTWNKKVAYNSEDLSKNEAMKVGINNFVPDVEINSGALTIEKANVEIKVSCEGETVPTTKYTVNGGAINFDASLVGKTVTVTVEPRYAIDNTHTVTYTVTLNNGVNVYNNADMKKAYADTSVSEINVLRNIKAELDASQISTFTSGQMTVTAPLNGSDVNGGTGVYERLSGNLKINGNYFDVNGKNIPFIDNRDPNSDRSFIDNGGAYVLMDVQFSIFLFGKRDTVCYDTMTMENLNIIGNVATESFATAGYKINGKDVLLNAGACIGVQVGSGTVALNNVTARQGSFAVNAYASGIMAAQGGGYTHNSNIVATDCNFSNNWSNNIYVYGFASVTLDSCFIGASNGAAIHFDAKPSAENVDCELTLLNDTEISNWVIGTESWFQAYGAVSAVNSIKTQVEGAVQGAAGLCSMSRTVIKKEGESQLVNFMILMKQTGDPEDWLAGKDNVGKGTINVNFGSYDVLAAGPLLMKAQAGTISAEEYAQLQTIVPTVANNYAKFGAAGAISGIAYLEGYVEIRNA